MREKGSVRPDGAAMERLLERHRYDPPGIVLRLAWREGLARREISELTWEQVDLENLLLRLPDREVPLDAETAERLRQWRDRCERFTPYVAASDKFRRRLATESLSLMARRALDEEGQGDVRLADLRRDFILRQLEEHDYPYALRVSGISLSTYRGGLFRQDTDTAPKDTPESVQGEDFALWRIMQEERTHAAGIALWLTSRLGLQAEEIVRLTWDDVDLGADTIRAGTRTVPLTVTVRHVLEDVRALRRPDDDPHVILTPRTRKPMDAARLTTVVRAALIRGGIENRTMQDLRRDVAWEEQREKLRAYVAEHGSISRMEASELLELSMSQVYTRLTKLADGGELELLKGRYYPAGAAIPPAKREEAVAAYIAEHGPITRKDAAKLLSVGTTTAATLLRKMAASGALVLLKGRYHLSGTAVPLPEREDAVVRYIAENGPVCRKDVARLLGVGSSSAAALLRKMTVAGRLEIIPGTKKYAQPENINISIN